MASMTILQAMQLAMKKHHAELWAEARSLYSQVLSFEPDHPEALHYLGVLTWQEGNSAAALGLLDSAIALQPGNAAYHVSRSAVLRHLNRFEEAIGGCREALRLDPKFAGAFALLAAIFLAMGKLDEAILHFQRALVLVPAGSNPQAARWENDLGIALAQSQRPADAIEKFQAAAARDGTFADPYVNMGLVYQQTGRLVEGEYACRRAIAIRPRYANAFNSLAVILSKQGKTAEAIAALRTAIEIQPGEMNAHVNLAQTLATAGEMDGAAEACAAAMKVSPNVSALHQVMGCVYRDIGDLNQSIAAFDRAIKLDPRDANAHSGRIFSRLFHAGSSQHDLADDQRLWDQRHGVALRKHRRFGNDRNPDRPLRIGYVSPDFAGNAVAFTSLPLIRAHDPAMFELYLYSDVANPGATTQQFRDRARKWTNIVGEPDQRAADMIREDRIDILVDLTMHMRTNRLGVFARKPAPIQVTWAAYPGSTGLSAIDYRLSDPYLDPPGMFDALHSEKTIRLPHTFWCYDPMTDMPAVSELPAATNGFITFGCLNNFCKVSEQSLRLWARILQAAPDSRLILLCPRGSHRQRVMKVFIDAGIHDGRVELVGRCARHQYLELYRRIDISLDPLPYNGHITSLDSLWMGVVVATLVGQTVAGRAGLSQLTNLGLMDLVAFDADRYVTLVANLAADMSRLKELRATLRQRLEQSPIMDEAGFARGVEEAYRRMWREWAARLHE